MSLWILLFVFGLVASLQECPSGFQEIGGSCFMMGSSKKTFKKATASCQEMGGFLMEPRSKEITTAMKTFKFTGSIWIGLNDVDKNSIFTWQMNRETLSSYTNWASKQPDNAKGNEYCVAVTKYGTWDDRYCDYKRAYICQAHKRKTRSCEATPTSDLVSLVTSSSSLQPGVTKEMEMNCSFQQIQDSDLSVMTSLILSKTDTTRDEDFKEVAIVNPMAADKIDVINDLGAGVTVYLAAERLSYINYKWQSPGSEVQGKYRCTMAGLNHLGHPVELCHDTLIQEISVDLQLLMSSLNTTQEQLLETQMQLNLTQSKLQTTQLKLNNTETQLDLCKSDNSTPNLRQTQILSLVHQSQLFENSTRFYKNRIYILSVPTTLNITTYQLSCGSVGGKLAEIRHQDEFDVITDYLTKQVLTDDFVYLGMTDEGHEGQWTYMSDNSTPTFTKWHSSRPNGGTGENCAILDGNMLMFDGTCFWSSSWRFMCEVSL